MNQHPNFHPYTWANNLALVQLASPFNMTDSAIARIHLPDETSRDDSVAECRKENVDLKMSTIACRHQKRRKIAGRQWRRRQSSKPRV